jgi:hypothetical protein
MPDASGRCAPSRRPSGSIRPHRTLRRSRPARRPVPRRTCERRRPRRRRSLSPRPGRWRAVRVVPWWILSSAAVRGSCRE